LGLCSILTGVAAAGKGAAYILCLDDDIVLHPGALAALVSRLAADGACFMATGMRAIYP
jgi:GT2 family glycosyltransferase